MSYEQQFREIQATLSSEGRWTPKAFEAHGVTCDGKLLHIPLFEHGCVTYDFSISDPEARKKKACGSRPKGSKVCLFGNLEILDAPVTLCEGEWDLFAAYEVGIQPVVTSTNGAGSNTVKVLRSLAGKDVNVIFDNDHAGQVGSMTAAKALKDLGCRVKVVDLSEHVPDKGDLRDFLNSGRTKEDLLNLINASPFHLSEVESKVEANLLKVRSLKSIEEKSVEWCLDGLIPVGSVTLLTGDPGSGKSTLASHIVSTVSNGGFLYDPPFGPRLEEKCVVVFSVEDPPEQVFKPRLVKFGARESNVFIYPDVLTLDEIGRATIREIARRKRPGLIIIDPIVAYVGGKMDTSKANEVREVMNFFMKTAEEFRLAVLIIRHMAKGSQNGGKLLYAGHGSIDFTASVRSELMLIKHPSDENLRLFGQIKNNFGRIGPALTITVSDDGLSFEPATKTLEQMFNDLSLEALAKKNRDVAEDVKATILKMLESRPMFSSIFKEELEESGIKPRTVARVLKNELAGKVEKERFNFRSQAAGKGRWITGLSAHIEHVRATDFASASELEDFLRTHAFVNSKFQECHSDTL